MLVGVRRVNRYIPTTPSAIPVTTSGLGPVRGSTRVCAVVEASTSTAVSGRKASPEADRREAEVQLQEERQEEEDAEDPRGGEQEREVRAAASPVQNDVQRQQRVAGAALDQDEGDRAAPGEATSAMIVAVAVQECVSALEKPYTRANRPSEPVSRPGMSIRSRSGARPG